MRQHFGHLLLKWGTHTDITGALPVRLLEDTNHMVSSLVTISANELMTAYYMVPSLVTISRSELMTAYHIVPSLVTISRSELMTANHMVGCLVNIGHNELRFESGGGLCSGRIR